MEKTILQYQRAFNAVVEKLRSNESVLAVMVFGSMVTGDLWDESDIDYFVIMEKEPSEIKNIYTEENDVPVHIKLMSKEKFLQLHESDLRGGFIHRIFASSRLVFSRDIDITTRYNNGRYYLDIDKERWNMVYFGNLLRNLSICKKYVYNEGIYTAYSRCVKSLEDYAKLYINSSGYMISKDAMAMAMNLDDNYKNCVEALLYHKTDIIEGVETTTKYLEKSINKNIKIYTSILLEYMKQKDCLLSTEDIKNDNLFECFDIAFEDILSELWKRNIIKKDTREYKDQVGKTIIKENVYFI
jgi:Nucleotidyltransferase domain.